MNSILDAIGGIFKFIVNYLAFCIIVMIGFALYMGGKGLYCQLNPGADSCTDLTVKYIQANRQQEYDDLEREYKFQMRAAQSKYSQEMSPLDLAEEHAEGNALNEYTKHADTQRFNNEIAMLRMNLENTKKNIKTRYDETVFAPIQMAHEQKLANLNAKYSQTSEAVYRELNNK
jgi:hypothetical protein